MKLKRNNLTLLELVVVLGIVASLATILLDNVADNKLRELESLNTQRGKLVENLMTGRDNKLGYSTFVSDMGRYPKTRSTDESSLLAELYDSTLFDHVDMFNHTATLNLTYEDIDSSLVDDDLPTVRMNVGWNGPYLNLFSRTQEKFTNAYGHPWRAITNWRLETDSSDKLVEYYDTSDDDLTENLEIDGIKSLGANNIDDEDEEVDGNITNANKDQEFLFAHNDNLARLNITVKLRDINNTWQNLSQNGAYSSTDKTTFDTGDIVYYNEKYYRQGNLIPTVFDETTWEETEAPVIRLMVFAPILLENSSSEEVMDLGYYLIEPVETPTYTDYSTANLEKKGEEDLYINSPDDFTSFNYEDDLYKLRHTVTYTWDKDGTTEFANYSINIGRLLTGKKMVFLFIAFRVDGKDDSSYITSSVEELDLVKGNNNLTLYLEPSS